MSNRASTSTEGTGAACARPVSRANHESPGGGVYNKDFHVYRSNCRCFQSVPPLTSRLDSPGGDYYSIPYSFGGDRSCRCPFEKGEIEREKTMNEHNRRPARTGHEAPFLFLPRRVVPGRYFFIVLAGIALALILGVGTAQTQDAAGFPSLVHMRGPHAPYPGAVTFMGYHERIPWGEADQFSFFRNDELVPRHDAETTGLTFPMFKGRPSLFLPAEWKDWPGYSLARMTGDSVLDAQEELIEEKMSERWRDTGRQTDLFEPKTLRDNRVYSLEGSLLAGEDFSLFHETRGEGPVVSAEPPKESVLLQPDPVSAGDPIGDGNEKYSLLHDDEQKNGGNIRLPLVVPWSRGKTDRAGILPDAIYLGTDFDYFSIAEDLQSWKAGSATLSSELNRLGSEWLNTPTGYIHFEWRLGK